MKIVEVVPIAKGVFKNHLTYFSNQNISVGAMVEIPIKNKTVEAIVSKIKEAETLKTELKKSDFSIKKLGKIKSQNFFLPEFLKATAITADYFACTMGQIIKSLTPKAVLEEPEINRLADEEERDKIETHCEIQATQTPEDERWSFYKSLIRETFAKKQSVFWCLPNSSDVEKAENFITRGIEQYVITLHGKLPKREILARWKKILNSEHPVLIIATPLFLSLPQKNISLIFIDKENTASYKDLSRPFLDFRYFAENYARQRKIRLIFGDTVLRSETIYRLGRGEISGISPIKYRLYTEAKQIIAKINTRDEERTNVDSLSRELVWLIENNREKNERLFIFSGRRGLAPLTICRDCQTVVTCDICHTPLVIHKKNTERQSNRFFVCHRCSQIVEINDRCEVCGGSRLAVVGYGLEKLEEDAKNLFPDLKTFRLDSDTVNNSKKAWSIIEKFLSSPGSVLFGTELALSYLTEKIENIGVAGIDAFFALPDFRIAEKLFSLLFKLRSLANRRFLVQTNNPSEKLFENILAGNLLDFFREEIAERKKLGYPPFKTIVKITLNGHQEEVKLKMKKLAKNLEAYTPIAFPSLTEKHKGFEYNLLLKLEPRDWPNNNLLKIFLSLPPEFVINVDPENIL